MYFTLKDSTRFWYLASTLEAQHCPGHIVTDLSKAIRIANQLLYESRNLEVAKQYLEASLPKASLIPKSTQHWHKVLKEQIESRRCLLLQGHIRELRIASTSKAGSVEWIPLETGWNSSASESPADAAGQKQGAEPIRLEASYEIATPETYEFSYAADPPAEYHSEYEIEKMPHGE